MEIFLVVFGFIVGICLGSLVKAIADRSIEEVSFLGRSYCQACKKILRWYDLFPVFSYLVLKGKCRYCHKKIPQDNLITEICLGTITAIFFLTFVVPSAPLLESINLQSVIFILEIVFKLFIISVLSIIFIVDLKTYIIPDRIIFPASFIASIYLLISSFLKSFDFYQQILKTPISNYLLPPHSNYFLDNLQKIWVSVLYSVGGALVASLFFALLIIGTKGKGMGWGDVKFVFFMGLALGYPNILVALFLAFFTGAIFSVGLITLGKKSFGQVIPFGPFLSLGALIALLWGPQIIDIYLQLSFQ